MKKLITILITLGLLISNPFLVKADINYRLLYEWSKQPTNVQNNLARNGVSIETVPMLDWQSTDISETYAYTRTYAIGNYVCACDIRLLNGHEECLTHEVGHALSNWNRNLFFWTNNQFWDVIYLQEAQRQILYPQGWQNKYEYFACCYDEYLNHPDYMKIIQPSSYNYMTVVMSYQ